MAELKPVTDAINVWGNQREDEGRALERQIANAELNTLRKQLSDLEIAFDAYKQAHPDSPPPPDPEPEPDPEPPPTTSGKKIIGMSANSATWNARLSEVGATGIEARRIFCQLDAGGRDQETLIRRAISDGMIPVLSWKASPADLISGKLDSSLANLKTFLNSLNTMVTATWWHEPHGDMTPEQFRAGSKRFVNRVQDTNIKVGPILNGWLLDNLKATNRANWGDYSDPELLGKWDFLGLDTYSEGTVASPNDKLRCGRAIPKCVDWLWSVGYPEMPILIGEYNGHTEAAIKTAGDYILNTPNVWIACQWNMDHMQNGTLKFSTLSGSRLTAFKATKADPRVQK